MLTWVAGPAILGAPGPAARRGATPAGLRRVARCL